MAIVKIPEILRHKLSDNGADALVDLLSEVEKSSRDNVVVLVEEKFERRLTEEISELRSRDLANLDRRITDEFSKLRTEDIADLDGRISQSLAGLDKRITDEISKLRSEDLVKLDKRITEESAKLDSRIADVVKQIAQSEVRILRWLVILWLTQMAAIFGILLKK